MSNIWLAKVEEIAAAIEARAEECDATDAFVAESYRLLAEKGLFKALVPAEFGGGGATISEVCQAIRRLGQACGSTALAFSMHSHLVAVAAWRWRHEKAPVEGLLRKVGEEGAILVSSGGSDWLPSGGPRSRSTAASASPRPSPSRAARRRRISSALARSTTIPKPARQCSISPSRSTRKA